MSQIVPFKKKVETVRSLLESAKQQIALALPRHLNPDRLARIVMTSVQRTPTLLDCTPQSLIGAVIQAAQLGLEPDGVLGHAYLVPYGNVATLIPGYKGLVDLARRSGQISTIFARTVHEADSFDYAYGLSERLEHTPSTHADRGPLTHVYAVARLRDGGVQFEVMSSADIEAIRARSKAGQSGPWVTDFGEMAKKTVLRRLCKLLPASVELQRAVALDERAEIGLPQHVEDVIEIPDAEIVEPENALDKIVAAGSAKKTAGGAQ